ncbi:hypothetical protein LCGC14_0549060 [marine sediment metagenome]|uniref:Calcineurin-like phosphoesterase domain-containing protein n=1 Tax=marine sediment metagenome TaxID=412755 RepID=A0A0F9UYM4_9ZZZZ
MIHRRIVLPDLHLPFHDKRLLTSWLNRLRDLPWDGVDIIGDFLDCYSLSRFDTNPQRKNNLQMEIDRGNEILAYIRDLQLKADIRYSEGNHEDRLRKLLWGKCPALAHLKNLNIPELLGLEKLKIAWHGTRNPYKIGDLWYTHGDILRKHAGLSARAKSEAIHGSVIIGHTHRMGWSPKTTWNGTDDAYEVGHMADPKQLDYVRTCFNWQPGWAEVSFENGTHWVNFFRVVDRGRERMVVGPEGVIDKWRTRR